LISSTISFLKTTVMVWIWNVLYRFMSWTAGPQLVVLMWEIMETLGNGASLQKADHKECAFEVCTWQGSMSHFLVPVHHDVNNFLLHMLLLPWCSAQEHRVLTFLKEWAKTLGTESLKYKVLLTLKYNVSWGFQFPCARNYLQLKLMGKKFWKKQLKFRYKFCVEKC
jgi:hypothetical protein